MLMDSLTMVLVDERLVPIDRVLEAIEVTIRAKRGMLDAGEDPETVEAAIGLLTNIANSISATRA